jgi:tetratricopeptide (TPR) repeat protein
MNPYVDAVTRLNGGDHDGAEKALRALLRNDFDNPILLFALGSAYVAKKETGLAFSLLKRALERLDDADEAYQRLGVFQPNASKEGRKLFTRTQKAECLNAISLCYRYEDNREEATRIIQQALALAPNHVDVNINMGCMHVNDGRPEAGIRWLKKALEIDPQSCDALGNLALLQLELGQWKDGFANYDEGSRRKDGLSRCYTHPDGSKIPLWKGEHGKSVVVYGEQGIGDEIMFASCIPDLQAISSRIVLDCHPRLVKLFERSFGIETHGTRKDEWIHWMSKTEKFDARCPIGSLPRYFRSNGDFPKTPYFKAGRNAAVDALPGYKIGLAWHGGSQHTRSNIRSMPIAELTQILRADASFVSLQYVDSSEEIAWMERKLGKRIQQFDFVKEQKSDYDLTAEVVNSLDLVIAVNTSVVHLCGALGKECWTLTPDKPAWRYGLRGEQMPWYGSVTQFRQAKGEPWSTVIERVNRALAERLGAKALAA